MSKLITIVSRTDYKGKEKTTPEPLLPILSSATGQVTSVTAYTLASGGISLTWDNLPKSGLTGMSYNPSLPSER